MAVARPEWLLRLKRKLGFRIIGEFPGCSSAILELRR
jgi:hypothetical protein